MDHKFTGSQRLLGLLFYWGIFLPFASLFSQNPASLYISEFLAVNESIQADDEGEYPDWIELHNPTSAPIQLQGYYLSDNENNLTKWSFPNILIEGGAYLLIFASGKDKAETELHTNFKLSSSGDHI